MNNLAQRFITAVVAGSVAVTAIVLSPYGLMLFGTIVSLAGLWEFLQWATPHKKYRWVTMGLGAAIWALLLATQLAGAEADAYLWGLLPTGLLLLALFVMFNKEETQPLPQLGGLVLGILYCFLPLVFFYKMAWTTGAYDYRIPLGVLILTWALDVGAYFAGRLLGGPKLFPRISPKKTWSGSIGGAILSLAIAGALSSLAFTAEGIPFSWWIVGAIIAVFSQLGDLAESMFKRSVAIKDSGSILPGHGGMLDRFDGIYFSVPLIFTYFSLL